MTGAAHQRSGRRGAPSANGTGAHPPANLEAERAVLGAMIRDNGVIETVKSSLVVQDFYLDAHWRIWRAILALSGKGVPVDLVTLADELQDRKEVADLGGYAYITELWDAAPSAGSVVHYAGIVKDRARLRRLAAFADRMASEARSPTGSGADLLEMAARELAAITEVDAEAGKGAIHQIDADDLLQQDAPEALEHLPLLGRDGYFVRRWSHLLAAFPRCGKTELMVACIKQWLRLGLQVLYFTEEPECLWRERLARRPGPWRGLQLVFALGVPVAELMALMVASEQEVIVVDTLRNLGLLGGDENDNAAVAKSIAPWIAAARNGGKTWFGLHHNRKGGGENGEGISGGHALMGAVDIALEINRDRNPSRRLVKGHARIFEIKELLYEQQEDDSLVALGDPSGVTSLEVRARLQTLLGEDWLRTGEVLNLLDEPRPSDELLRQVLQIEAKSGRIERDPPISAGRVRGKTIRWRSAPS